jgi:transcription-repair coupling factor (superfamily II helicase)
VAKDSAAELLNIYARCAALKRPCLRYTRQRLRNLANDSGFEETADQKVTPLVRILV